MDLLEAIKNHDCPVQQILEYIKDHPLLSAGLSPDLNPFDHSLAMTIAEDGSDPLVEAFFSTQRTFKLNKKSTVNNPNLLISFRLGGPSSICFWLAAQRTCVDLSRELRSSASSSPR